MDQASYVIVNRLSGFNQSRYKEIEYFGKGGMELGWGQSAHPQEAIKYLTCAVLHVAAQPCFMIKSEASGSARDAGS